jgi:squalene-hopene/tetraprenyl-beta-curcumene cyclase
MKGENGALINFFRPQKAIEKAKRRFLSLQAEEGYWCFELEADCTIPSEYILLQRFLGREINTNLTQQIAAYLLRCQLADGGWPLYAEDGFADISASIKAYFALKLIGHSTSDSHMVSARKLILSLGGAANCNVFTRITLALFGQIPWRTLPAMPIEIMLLPRWFFFHLDKVSYWSRTVITPLLILYAKRPICRLKPAEIIPELFVTPPAALYHIDGFAAGVPAKNLFILLDRILKLVIPLMPAAIHQAAFKRAQAWMLDHMRGVGGIGAIFPAMANAVMALKVLGYPQDHPAYTRGVKAIDDLLQHRRESHVERPKWSLRSSAGKGRHAASVQKIRPAPSLETALRPVESICQPCVSPIWDTCLTLNALLEAGLACEHSAIRRSVAWLFSKQIKRKGDWSVNAPDLESGGWAFQFENDFYPDVDDTAMVVMALVRAGVRFDESYRQNMAAAVKWVVGMQSSDGGWASFDIDNNALYLNHIPFADHGALLDPSTSDLTARCIEMLAMLGFKKDYLPIARGLKFLRQEQESFGGWFGRWGVNYIYGTWSVLSALRQAGEDMSQPYIRKAVDWLKARQNPDSGWGETCYTYTDPSLAGMGESTPSQTAWSLLALMAAGEWESSAVKRGVKFLIDRQNPDGGWDETHFTGTGFPKVFYLRYHGYSQYFPLWALSVYLRLGTGPKTCQDEMRWHSPPNLLT